MPSPAPLKAVLFDRDDTLAYTDPAVYREAAQWVAARYGVGAQEAGRVLAGLWQEQADAWWDLRSLSDEEAFWERYGTELSTRLGLGPDAAPELLGAFPYERYMKPVAGTREVLEELRGRGLKIGVLSNTLPSIDRTLEAVGLSDLVDVALATCTLGVHKPEPRAFTLAAEALGVEPEEVLFVDDRPENVEAARALGMRSVLIDLEGANPKAIHHPRDVLELAGF
ncbi:putative hydrolase of the HAD superfamily [Deinococcus reticulitermitis]|uniref:Putative hydrolase of the HAD superfamily n=1 Tax=Deinococcus reticulitermitis TaxID=856736 RepID=A0A1H7A963_9DEIO|nr:HAD family phosphatase [Deinococcus reticulitermitis]SEJ61948.1 putative hydrolase of the HAD superfamily [Deinococcus reticulitermitis]